MVCQDGRWYLFFEVLNQDSDRGEIGLALSDDGIHWEYSRIVLVEPFHLSYPHVFQWHDDYYMTPETLGAGCVSLYRATRFPTDWTRIAPILPVKYADPTIFRADGLFWMFGCVPVGNSDTLRLYYAADLMTSWQEHPKSPIVEGDARIARPAGRVTLWDDRRIRFAQDCHTRYGDRVRAFEILELTPTAYREREVEESPVLCATTGQGWNRQRMHHMDPHPMTDGRWIACVDGC